jgi:hypothetical protein
MNIISVNKDEIKQRIAKLKEDMAKSKNKEYKKVLRKQIKYWKDRLDWFYQNDSYSNPGNGYSGQEDYKKIRELEGYTPFGLGYTAIGDAVISKNVR